MQLHDKIKNLLKEDPDNIYAGDLDYNATYPGSYAFAYYNNKFIVSDEEGTHYDLAKSIPDDAFNEWKKKQPDNMSARSSRKFLTFPGRFWKHPTSKTENAPLISFWYYPKPNQLIHIIRELQNHFGRLKDLKIQVYDDRGKEILIPVDEYQGETYKVNTDKEHVVSPMLKKKKEEKPPHPLKDKLPNGMSIARYHNLIHQESEEID